MIPADSNLRKIKKMIIYVLIPFQLVFYFLIYYQQYSQTLPMMRTTEHRWIGRSFFFDLFWRRDWHNPLWQTHSSYEQPKIAEYYLGAFLYPKYLAEKPSGNPDYDMAMYLIDNNFYFNTENVTEEKYLEKEKKSLKWWNTEKLTKDEMLNRYGNKIINTFDIIFRLRRAISLILALNVAVFYLIILTSFSPVVSFFTAFIYGHNMIFLEGGIFARSEAIFVFFFNLGVYFLLRIFYRRKWKAVNFVGFAVSAAFCAQTKLNGVMLLIFFNALYLIKIFTNYFYKFRFNFKRDITLIILVNILTFCIFTMIDPYLYSNTFENIGKYFSHRWETTLSQTKNPDYFNMILPDFKKRIMAVYYNFTGNNIYMDLSFVTYNFPFGQFRLSGYLLVILLITGIVSIVIKAVKKKNIFSTQFLMLLLFIMTQITMGFYLMFNFSRYFIQLVAFFLFFEIAGSVYLCKSFIRIIKK